MQVPCKNSLPGTATAMETFLASTGISPTDLYAAFAGSVVAALVSAGSEPRAWNVFTCVIVGTLTGAFIPSLPTYLGIRMPGSGNAFLTSIAAMPTVKGIIAAASKIKWPATGESSP